MKTYFDNKNRIFVRIVYIRPSGKVQCRCLNTGIFLWRNSIKDLMLVEHWMLYGALK